MDEYKIGDLLMMHRLSLKPVIGIVKDCKVGDISNSKYYFVEWISEDAGITTNVWFAECDIQYYRQAYVQYAADNSL
jgi:hypothetical protein